MNRWFMYYKADSPRSGIGVKTAPVEMSGDEVKVPANADWTDHGIVLSEGSGWDKRFYGALSPCSVVKKDGTYFLYYIGAEGDRSSDGGPRRRALGVATSSDGLHFTKYGGNPILRYLPHNNEEEGIFSAAAFLDVNGEIVMYYSALDAGSPTSTLVDSDIRLAISSNGLNFADKGDVISHADSKVWGHGDELFPVGTFREGNTWYLYYIAKGHGAYWDLGLAQGSSRTNIHGNTQHVLTSTVKGGCDPMYLSTSKIALFVSEESAGVRVRTASVSSPESLSSPVETYPFVLVAMYLDIVGPPPPPPTYNCPLCEATDFDSPADLDAHIMAEHPGQVIEKVFYHQKENSGTVEVAFGNPPKLWISTATNDIFIRNKPAYQMDHRGFLSFDTSSIPEVAVIQSAFIKVMGITKYSGWTCVVDYSLYGTLDLGDWGRVPEQANIASQPTGPNVWRESSRFTQVNKGGISQYRLHEPTASTGFACFYAGNSPQQPELHVRYMIPAPPPPTYPCPFCEATFGSPAELDNHIESEHPTETFTTQEITCSQCNSILKLTISSIAANNTSQNCPVCGLSGVGEGTKIETVEEEPWPPEKPEEPFNMNCPACNAVLTITPPTVPVAQVVTMLYCPLCGAEVWQAPTEGYTITSAVAAEEPWYKKYAPHLAIGGGLVAALIYFTRKK